MLVEWDPYRFSILTEESGQIGFCDIIEDVTVHEIGENVAIGSTMARSRRSG